MEFGPEREQAQSAYDIARNEEKKWLKKPNGWVLITGTQNDWQRGILHFIRCRFNHLYLYLTILQGRIMLRLFL